VGTLLGGRVDYLRAFWRTRATGFDTARSASRHASPGDRCGTAPHEGDLRTCQRKPDSRGARRRLRKGALLFAAEHQRGQRLAASLSQHADGPQSLGHQRQTPQEQSQARTATASQQRHSSYENRHHP
jgi:hypothetical protein